MSASASDPLPQPALETGQPSMDPSVDAFRLTVTRLARQLRKHSAADLTPTQLSALDSLGRQGRIKAGRLAQIEGISKPTATRLTGKLQDMGLVERTQDDVDARSWQVELTPKGEHLLATASTRADEFLASKISAISRDDQRKLMEALPALVRLLEIKT
jgi:DNA-binding MarR family transcriptional regulator